MDSGVPRPPPLASIVGPIRNSVRALILQRNAVLLLKKRLPRGTERYALPGGGQDQGEPLHEALLRECSEEIGVAVEIVSLVHVANAFKLREAKSASYRQQVEFVFLCRVPGDYLPRSGDKPDKFQIGVEWVGLQHLDRIDLRPAGMTALIRQAALGRGPVYLGTL